MAVGDGSLISIHALRKESDDLSRVELLRFEISIHALRKESDARSVHVRLQHEDFNPRSP